MRPVFIAGRKTRHLQNALFVPPFLDDPFAGVILDIFPYFIIILLISNHMIVIGSLENNSVNFPMAKSLEGGNKVRNNGIRRGRRPRRPFLFIITYQKIREKAEVSKTN